MKKILLLFVSFNIVCSELEFKKELSRGYTPKQIDRVEEKSLASIESFKRFVPVENFNSEDWLYLYRQEMTNRLTKGRSFYIDKLWAESVSVRNLCVLKLAYDQVFQIPRTKIKFDQILSRGLGYNINKSEDVSTIQIREYFIKHCIDSGFIKNQELPSLMDIALRRIQANLYETLKDSTLLNSDRRVSLIEYLQEYLNSNNVPDDLRELIYGAVVNNSISQVVENSKQIRPQIFTSKYSLVFKKGAFEYKDLQSGEIKLINVRNSSFDLQAMNNDWFILIERNLDFNKAQMAKVKRILRKPAGHQILAESTLPALGDNFVSMYYNGDISSCFEIEKDLVVSQNKRYAAFICGKNIYLFDSLTGQLHKKVIEKKHRIRGVFDDGQILAETFNPEINYKTDDLIGYGLDLVVLLDVLANKSRLLDIKLKFDPCEKQIKEEGLFFLNKSDFLSDFLIVFNKETQEKIVLPEGFVFNDKDKNYLGEDFYAFVICNKDCQGQKKLFVKIGLDCFVFDSDDFCILGENIVFFDRDKLRFVAFNVIDQSLKEIDYLNSNFINIQDRSEFKQFEIKFIGQPFLFKDKPFIVFSIKRIYNTDDISLNTEELVLYDFNLKLFSVLPEILNSYDLTGNLVSNNNSTLDQFADLYLRAEAFQKIIEERKLTLNAQDQPSTLEAVLAQDEPS